MEFKFKYPKLKIDQVKYEEYRKQQKFFLDKQLANLPKDIVFCKRCIMSNQRPRTQFDHRGWCNACCYAERKFGKKIDWEAREKELQKLLDRYRSKDGSWDVVVPSSGGKDSAYVAHLLKYRYGMHPLTVTWAPFAYTQEGFRNYVNMIQTGFDGLVAWPDGKMHRKLSRITFELKGDAFEPFVYGQKAYAFHIALKFKIPLIFYGENGEVEYGGSFKNVDKPYESPEDWDDLYFKGTKFDLLLQEGLKMGIFTEDEIQNHNFDFYKAPPLEEIKKLNIQMHWWSYYFPWVPEENVYYAIANTGFEPHLHRIESTYSRTRSFDDQFDGFHYYLAYIKFGYNRATREASSDIRCGHIERDEGVALANRYDHEFPKRYFKSFLEYLDITEEHFWEVIDRYRRPEVWKKENGKWKRRAVVANAGVKEPDIE